ncbi:MAG: sn-glycerol-3-phosphate ABC transporter ATP-binding protein UgpC [Alphaproteobacteria bacterium]|nr:MAG: sn-glycerol-3-phosphate ABC transporter ATP-binding protein UgpC [Alphaproteobacteria bacterium]
MAAVALLNLVKRFGTTEVVRNLSLEIADAEFLVLVGPSGCGKSTTLRMVAGLEDASGGDIRIGGRLVNRVPPKDRNIAMVFQNYALYPHMTVARNMAFGLRAAKLPAAEIARRVADAAQMLGLEALLERRPGELSGGQRQRVAMGRAIVREPDVFLFDEPLSNLDAKLRHSVRTEIKKLHQRVRTTSLYVTHDQIEAMTLADRVVVMRDGRIEQVGTPLEVYQRPANVFVASFIGSPAMTLLDGVVTAERSVRLSDQVSLPVPERPALTAGQRVMLGVRPDDLTVGEAVGDSMVGFHAAVTVVEPLGPGTLVTLDVGGREVTATTDGRRLPSVGQVLPLRVERERLHLFDPDTGLAL